MTRGLSDKDLALFGFTVKPAKLIQSKKEKPTTLYRKNNEKNHIVSNNISC